MVDTLVYRRAWILLESEALLSAPFHFRGWECSRLEMLWEDSERQRSSYLIQCAAGSCRSWGLRRQGERLWDSPAAILRHPRQSGALSHTSPGICRKEGGDAVSSSLSSAQSTSSFLSEVSHRPPCKHMSRTRTQWHFACSLSLLWEQKKPFISFE